MENTNIQQFLDSLTEEQRAAVLVCKTEEELEQVIDDYDIDLPDEMLADVAGGKARLLPTLLAGIIMMSGTAFTAGSVTASAAKVYLTQDISGKGKKGDIIEVSDGYANNFLIPKGLAVLVTNEILTDKKPKNEADDYRIEQEIKKAKELMNFLNGKSITVYGEAGVNGKLYGSVTAKEMADAIKSTYDIYIDKRCLNTPEITNFGSYQIKLQLYPGIAAQMTVTVCLK